MIPLWLIFTILGCILMILYWGLRFSRWDLTLYTDATIMGALISLIVASILLLKARSASISVPVFILGICLASAAGMILRGLSKLYYNDEDGRTLYFGGIVLVLLGFGEYMIFR